MAHIVKGPGVFDDQYWYPLRLIINNEHSYAKNYSCCVDDEKDNVKNLFVPRLFFVISNIKQPIPYFHTIDYTPPAAGRQKVSKLCKIHAAA